MIRSAFLTGFLILFTVLFLTPLTHAGIYLTVNVEDVKSIMLTVDGWCTVEVASENSAPYLASVDYSEVEGGTFSHFVTNSQTGEYACVEYFDGYYETSAFGMTIPPSLGIHFVFRYNASRLYEEFDIVVRNSSLTFIDFLHITAIG